MLQLQFKRSPDLKPYPGYPGCVPNAQVLELLKVQGDTLIIDEEYRLYNCHPQQRHPETGERVYPVRWQLDLYEAQKYRGALEARGFTMRDPF